MAKAKGLKKFTTKLKKLIEPFDKTQRKSIGKVLVDAMRNTISKGINPIASGPRRFPAYKNPKKYPGNRKSARPVNLFLTGQQMGALQSKVRSGNNIELGYFDDFASKKERGHREQDPSRPTIPKGSEKLSDNVKDKVITEMAKQFKKKIKKLF